MANRCLYGSRSFIVIQINQCDNVWHLIGRFAEGSVRSKCDKEYHIRVEPDLRWVGVKKISFHDSRIYECESIGYHSRRHIYGSGNWYISPHFNGSRDFAPKRKFTFDDFDVSR